MNPREQDDAAFDKAADATLRRLDRALGGFDPDELEAELAGDVLTVTLGNGEKVVINRQRAARQMWMAAQRRAWHFDRSESGEWRTSSAELMATLEQVLTSLLKRPIKLTLPAG